MSKLQVFYWNRQSIKKVRAKNNFDENLRCWWTIWTTWPTLSRSSPTLSNDASFPWSLIAIMMACNLMQFLRLRASNKGIGSVVVEKGLSALQNSWRKLLAHQQQWPSWYRGLLLGMRDTADEDLSKMLHFSDRWRYTGCQRRWRLQRSPRLLGSPSRPINDKVALLSNAWPN